MSHENSKVIIKKCTLKKKIEINNSYNNKLRKHKIDKVYIEKKCIYINLCDQ